MAKVENDLDIYHTAWNVISLRKENELAINIKNVIL